MGVKSDLFSAAKTNGKRIFQNQGPEKPLATEQQKHSKDSQLGPGQTLALGPCHDPLRRSFRARGREKYSVHHLALPGPKKGCSRAGEHKTKNAQHHRQEPKARRRWAPDGKDPVSRQSQSAERKGGPSSKTRQWEQAPSAREVTSDSHGHAGFSADQPRQQVAKGPASYRDEPPVVQPGKNGGVERELPGVERYPRIRGRISFKTPSGRKIRDPPSLPVCVLRRERKKRKFSASIIDLANAAHPFLRIIDGSSSLRTSMMCRRDQSWKEFARATSAPGVRIGAVRSNVKGPIIEFECRAQPPWDESMLGKHRPVLSLRVLHSSAGGNEYDTLITVSLRRHLNLRPARRSLCAGPRPAQSGITSEQS